MAVEYSSFIDEATSLLGVDEVSEIKCRCSISRAYYGLYHVALEYADSVSVPPVSDCAGGTHQKLSVFYQEFLNADASVKLKHRRVGYSLKQLHESRVKADYKLDQGCTKDEAQSHLVRCNDLVKLVLELSAAQAA